MLTSARKNLAIEQARLTEIEAELPFLLGRHDGQANAASDGEPAAIRKQLVPLLEQLITVRKEKYQQGESSLAEIFESMRRVAELKVQIADSRAGKVKVVESHIALAKSVLEISKHNYKSAQSSTSDVLSAQIQVVEAELWLEELKQE